eukprot:scaffold33572_cov47-Phaeocystis_antarctica.AAC.2
MRGGSRSVGRRRGYSQINYFRKRTPRAFHTPLLVTYLPVSACFEVLPGVNISCPCAMLTDDKATFTRQHAAAPSADLFRLHHRGHCRSAGHPQCSTNTQRQV